MGCIDSDAAARCDDCLPGEMEGAGESRECTRREASLHDRASIQHGAKRVQNRTEGMTPSPWGGGRASSRNCCRGASALKEADLHAYAGADAGECSLGPLRTLGIFTDAELYS